MDSDRKEPDDLAKEILEELLRDRVYAKLLTTLKAIGASKYREGVREQVAAGRFTHEQARAFDKMAENIIDTMVASLRKTEEERDRKHHQEATERLNEQALMARVLFGAELTDETIGRRKAALATSIAAIAVTKGGMLPHEIPSFGVSLEPANQSALIWLGIALTVYFTVGFVVGIYIDSQKALRDPSIARELISWVEGSKTLEKIKRGSKPTWTLFRSPVFRFLKDHKQALVLFLAWLAYDFFLPITLSLYALWCLWTYPLPVRF